MPATRSAAPGLDDRAGLVATVVLVVLAVAFLATAWPRITAPFGDSDEGINGAVWGFDSRALRELGPVDSRLGGVRTDGTKYATHPPLIVVEAALIERVVGEHPWSTRAAAWIGSLAAILLLFLLVKALGLSPVAAACAVVAAVAGHMLFVYGTMLDTMIIAFPFAVATLLVWYRGWTADATDATGATDGTDATDPAAGVARPRQPVHPVLVGLLATIAGLGGWQAIFLVALCAVGLLGRFRSRGVRRALVEALPYAVAVVLATALTLAWAHWVYGSFSVLGDKLGRRTGSTESVSIPDMVTFQLPWLTQLLGLGFLVGWVACAVSLRDKRFRPLAAISLASVILYALLLKEGSGGHQYWNYWALLPATIGSAYLFGLLDRRLARSMRRQPAKRWAVLVALALVVAVVNLHQVDEAGDLIDRGVDTYHLVTSTPLAPGQTDIPYVAEPFRIDDWLRYDGDLPGHPVMSADELRQLARDHPDDVVFVIGGCADPDPTGICNGLFEAGHDQARASTAAALAAQLPH
jgi:hypothetical protein